MTSGERVRAGSYSTFLEQDPEVKFDLKLLLSAHPLKIEKELDKVVRHYQLRYPMLSTYQMFGLVASAVPHFMPHELNQRLASQAKRKENEQGEKYDTLESASARNCITLLNAKSFLSAVNRVLPREREIDEDYRDELLHVAINSVPDAIDGIESTRILSAVINTQAYEKLIEYISKENGSPNTVTNASAQRLFEETRAALPIDESTTWGEIADITDELAGVDPRYATHRREICESLVYQNPFRVSEVVGKDNIENEVEERMLRSELNVELGRIPDLMRQVIELRYDFLDDRIRSYHVLAREFRFTRERIRILEKGGLYRIQENMLQEYARHISLRPLESSGYSNTRYRPVYSVGIPPREKS